MRRPQLSNTHRLSRALVWIVLLAVGVSCTSFDDRAGSSGGAEGPTVDATGQWAGSWAVTYGVPDAGEVFFDIEQDEDGNVFGTSEWTGSPCWSNWLLGAGPPEDPGPAFTEPPVTDRADALPMVFSARIAGNVMPGASVVDILSDPNTVPLEIRRLAYRASARLEIVGERMIGTFVVTNPNNATDATNPERSRCNDLADRLGDEGVVQLIRL